MYYRKIKNYTSRTNRRHKSVDIAGYPSIILGYPSKYCNYTSKKKLGWLSYSLCPIPPPQWITFLIFMSQNILLNIEDEEFDFRIGCILVILVFMNNKCAIYKFQSLEFSILLAN